MKNSAIRFILTLIASSLLLPAALNQEGLHAQDSSPSTTNDLSYLLFELNYERVFGND
jgi:hypothetical protein